jgi:hypothetical protein
MPGIQCRDAAGVPPRPSAGWGPRSSRASTSTLLPRQPRLGRSADAHFRLEAQRIVARAGAGDPAQQPGGDVGGEVNIRAQPAAGAAQRRPLADPLAVTGPCVGILVIRPCPLCASARSGRSGRGDRRRRPWAERDAPGRRADVRARSWTQPTLSTLALAPVAVRLQRPRDLLPCSVPNSADAGYRWSAMAQTAPADPPRRA